MAVFRLLLGVAVLWKVLYEMRLGGLHYFDDDAIIRWRYTRSNLPVKLVVSRTFYRSFAYVAAGAAVLLFVGFEVRTAAIVLTSWFVFEHSFNRLYHPMLLGLCCAAIALSPAPERYLSVANWIHTGRISGLLEVGASTQASSDPWPQILVVLLVIQMYWSSAWIKLNSRQFMSGDVLQKLFEHTELIQTDMPFREVTYPRWILRRMAEGGPDAARRRWRWPALATIATEISVPALLLFPATWIIGAVLGAVMHIAFTGIFAKRLVPFTVATLAAYPLFLNPVVFTNWIFHTFPH